MPAVNRITLADLTEVLARGLDDLGAYRSDVIFLCIIYPLAGVVLVWQAFHYALLPLLFPLVSGFALIGPVAAVGLYEISRRRERGDAITWADAFGVLRAPAIGAIVVLGLVLLAIFLLWLAAAYAIYLVTLGPEPPTSVGAFAREVFTTGAGWAMIVVELGSARCSPDPGAEYQRRVVPAPPGSRRRAIYRNRDVGVRGAGEPGADGGLGTDRGGRPGPWFAPPAPWPRARYAGAGARHLAPLSQGGAALSTVR